MTHFRAAWPQSPHLKGGLRGSSRCFREATADVCRVQTLLGPQEGLVLPLTKIKSGGYPYDPVSATGALREFWAGWK